MDSVYIVVGEAGDYDDYRLWIVEAYANKEWADTRVRKLHQLWLQFEGTIEAADDWGKLLAVRNAMQDHPEGDPGCDTDWGGVSYRVIQTEYIA